MGETLRTKGPVLSLLGMIRACGVNANAFVLALLIWGADYLLGLLVFADRTEGPLVGAGFRVTGGFSVSFLLLLATPAIQLIVLRKRNPRFLVQPKYSKVLFNQIKFIKTPILIFIITFVIIGLGAPLFSVPLLPVAGTGREALYVLIAALLTPLLVFYFFVGCVAASGFPGKESDSLRNSVHLVKRNLVLVSFLVAVQYLGPVGILYFFGTSFLVQAVSGGLSVLVGPLVLVGVTDYYFSVQPWNSDTAVSNAAGT